MSTNISYETFHKFDIEDIYHKLIPENLAQPTLGREDDNDAYNQFRTNTLLNEL